MVERIFEQKESSREESQYDYGLRPTSLENYVGQDNVVENLKMMIKSALIRKKSMDHVLFAGPPGLGKTTLAYLVAKELNSELHVVAGPAIEKKADLAATLTNLSPGDVLFIDEIHRLPIAVEEILYSAMEDFRIDILIGSGAGARAMQIDLPPFTLVGATTRTGLLSHPLRDRFLSSLHFEFYGDDELAKIVGQNCGKVGVSLPEKTIQVIAERSRGTPRIANRILRRIRDFALVNNLTMENLSDLEEALRLLKIDKIGLDSMDLKILKVMKDYYNGGPVGIDALSATLNEDRETIEDVYEPFLLKRGLIIRTPRGRVLSEFGRKHID